MILQKEIGPMYVSLAPEENNQNRLNKLCNLYKVNNPQENASGSTSLHITEKRTLPEKIFKKTDIY